MEEISPVQLSQAPIQDDQPNSAYPHEDLCVHYKHALIAEISITANN